MFSALKLFTKISLYYKGPDDGSLKPAACDCILEDERDEEHHKEHIYNL